MDRLPPHLRPLLDALDVSPDNVPLRKHLGEQLLTFGLNEESAKLFADGLRLAPASDALQLGFAKANERLGQVAKAKSILEELVRRPGQGEAHFLLAQILAAEGAGERAKQHYEKAITIDPSLANAEVVESMAGILKELDEEDGDDNASEEESEDDVDAMGRRLVRAGQQGEFQPPKLERPTIDFRSVGGMEGVKDEIRMKVIHPLVNSELFKAYGKAIGGGILLYGPPGCGKTHLARATAGEAKATFLALGIHDVLDMWLGQSEQRLHQVFAYARKNAPCVLFFDEVDALAASRHDLRQSGGRNVVNQFLNELDGVTHSNDGVLILAATNAPWHLDSAFRRPGRFDRIIFVPPPDEAARASVLSVLLEGKPVGALDLKAVAKRTPERSGADLKAVVDRAIEGKLREAMKTGRPLPLETKDLLAAANDTPPSTKEWFATARNYVLHANESGAYDDVAKYLGISRGGAR
ncbi:MAG: ATP-binding protein [Phycisphaerae bacterium]|jgi:transitional endoplasmic reticulum ATPase|nr:ATP-binding protein [Phycisphaerae bacterium]